MTIENKEGVIKDEGLRTRSLQQIGALHAASPFDVTPMADYIGHLEALVDAANIRLSKAESKIVHLGALVSPDANMAEQIARYLDGRARKELDGSMERMQVSRAAEWLRHLRTAPEARELETARADCEQQHREYLEERQEHQATLALAAKEREYAGELHTAALVAATTLEYAKCPVAARTLRAVLEKAPNNARHVAGVDGSPARADSVLTPAVGSEPHGEGCGSNPPAAHQTALTELEGAARGLYRWLMLEAPRLKVPDDVWEPFQDALFDKPKVHQMNSIERACLSRIEQTLMQRLIANDSVGGDMNASMNAWAALSSALQLVRVERRKIGHGIETSIELIENEIGRLP